MYKVLAILLLCFVFGNCSKTQCKLDSECGSGECCYYHEGPMVMSKKRQFEFKPVLPMHQGGWCEKYRLQGESCSGIAKMNGHCGCSPGLKCTFFQDAILIPTALVAVNPIRRSMIPGGHMECQP